MNALDLAFPPEECDHDEYADKYIKATVPIYPPYGYISPEMLAQAHLIA